MELYKVVNSIFTSYTYILPVGEKECWLVDCGDIDKVIEAGWKVKGVLLTHVHFDHIYGLNELMKYMPNAVVYTNTEGQQALQNPKWNFSKYHLDQPNFIFDRPDAVRVIKKECWISLDSVLSAFVIFTPGHDSSCLSFVIDNIIFTGDSYIPGVNVVTTLPRSNKEEAAFSLDRLRKLEESGFVICPGHLV